MDDAENACLPGPLRRSPRHGARRFPMVFPAGPRGSRRAGAVLFTEDDIIVVVGQDGLVPNTAKYLDGQRVIGINPDPGAYDGVLCRHKAADVGKLVEWAASGKGNQWQSEKRVLLKAGAARMARRSWGSTRSSSSTARTSRPGTRSGGTKAGRQSSPGRDLCRLVGRGVQGGPGRSCSSGVARAASQADDASHGLPRTVPLGVHRDDHGSWFSGEGGRARDRVEMGEGGVIFADGIESDRVEFVTGER